MLALGSVHVNHFCWCWYSAEEDPEVHLGQLKRFSLRELQVASDNFNNKNILGHGGFGKVYKGRLVDGTLVAVKRLREGHSRGGELQFQTEVCFDIAVPSKLSCPYLIFLNLEVEETTIYSSESSWDRKEDHLLVSWLSRCHYQVPMISTGSHSFKGTLK